MTSTWHVLELVWGDLKFKFKKKNQNVQSDLENVFFILKRQIFLDEEEI